MACSRFRSTAIATIAAFVLTAAFGVEADSASVADQFIRAYFHDDNLAEAVKLTSGAAEERLGKELKQIQSVGAKEPAKDKPAVTTELVDTQPASPDESLYFYRVSSSVEGIEPITTRLTLRKKDTSWHVSGFEQYEYTGRE